MHNLIGNKNEGKNTVGTFQKSNRKIVKRGKIETIIKQIHFRALSWLDRGTPVKCGGAKLILRVQATPRREIMRSCKQQILNVS